MTLRSWAGRHMFHIIEKDKEQIESNVDEYGDSYVRDVTVDELKDVSKINLPRGRC